MGIGGTTNFFSSDYHTCDEPPYVQSSEVQLSGDSVPMSQWQEADGFYQNEVMSSRWQAKMTLRLRTGGRSIPGEMVMSKTYLANVQSSVYRGNEALPNGGAKVFGYAPINNYVEKTLPKGIYVDATPVIVNRPPNSVTSWDMSSSPAVLTLSLTDYYCNPGDEGVGEVRVVNYSTGGKLQLIYPTTVKLEIKHDLLPSADYDLWQNAEEIPLITSGVKYLKTQALDAMRDGIITAWYFAPNQESIKTKAIVSVGPVKEEECDCDTPIPLNHWFGFKYGLSVSLWNEYRENGTPMTDKFPNLQYCHTCLEFTPVAGSEFNYNCFAWASDEEDYQYMRALYLNRHDPIDFDGRPLIDTLDEWDVFFEIRNCAPGTVAYYGFGETDLKHTARLFYNNIGPDCRASSKDGSGIRFSHDEMELSPGTFGAWMRRNLDSPLWP